MKTLEWKTQLKYDPITPLLSVEHEILTYFVERDLLGMKVGPIETVWMHPDVQNILKKQQPDGSWKSSNMSQYKYPVVNYALIETWKQLRYLVQMYQMTNENSSIQKAAEYIFSCQTEDGDIRGFLGNQYAAYYTGAILFLLISAGYTNDSRVLRGLEWLLSIRQDDGGWLASFIMSLELTYKRVSQLTYEYTETIKERNSTKPSSHNWTGMIIRPFSIFPLISNG